jgi:hypothetical protein
MVISLTAVISHLLPALRRPAIINIIYIIITWLFARNKPHADETSRTECGNPALESLVFMRANLTSNLHDATDSTEQIAFH